MKISLREKKVCQNAPAQPAGTESKLVNASSKLASEIIERRCNIISVKH
jgi:hypothetical protein